MTPKTTESRPVNRAMANTHIQAKLNVNRPGDRFEAEADRAASAVVDHINGRSKNNPTKPTSVEVSRLQNGATDTQRQCCEEEEMQTKLQRQPLEEEEEEMQMKVQRHVEEEEEMQTKLQRQPLEEEEEEMQMKIQRQAEEEEEEMQMNLQRHAEEEEMQTKLQRQPLEEEEEEMQMKIQRQAEEEEEEMQMNPDNTSSSGSDMGSPGHLESRIAQRRGQGKAMDDFVKGEMESGFGADFSGVRVHTDSEASEMSSNLNAQAFTTGNDIYFSESKYQPGTKSGKTLLAHELTHVIQQGGSTQDIARKSAAGELVEEEPVKDIISPGVKPSGVQKMETRVQRQDAGPADAGTTADSGDATTAEAGGETPEPAVPTLNVTPGNTLTRGQTLSASIGFEANGGESYRITRWRFTTGEHGNITRPSDESDYQSSWEGKMAVSGTLEVSYRITPEDGEEGPEQTLSEEITVEDRSGEMWEAEVDEQGETPYNGAPSPPTQFPNLGHHDANITDPDPDLETISSGPNKNLRFVNELEAGTYTSAPQIHPDLLDDSSDFYTFHLNAGILYIVIGETETEVPRSEYSNLVVGENNVAFDVPDWDAFFKSHDMIRVTASVSTEEGENTYVVPESAWALDSNSRDANINITNDQAIRNGLGIGADEDYELDVEVLGSFSGVRLMQAPAILAGTRSHEYAHGTHSHRANFVKMMRALDPERKIENKVSSASNPVNFNSLLREWRNEILEPYHEIVDEAASEEQEEFVAIGGETMADINSDPDSGGGLGAVWNISANQPMGN